MVCSWIMARAYSFIYWQDIGQRDDCGISLLHSRIRKGYGIAWIILFLCDFWYHPYSMLSSLLWWHIDGSRKVLELGTCYHFILYGTHWYYVELPLIINLCIVTCLSSPNHYIHPFASLFISFRQDSMQAADVVKVWYICCQMLRRLNPLIDILFTILIGIGILK